MRVNEIMSEHLAVAHPDTSIVEAAKKMEEFNTGALPVCDEREYVLGMLTDRDLAIRVLAAGLDPERTQVKDVMSAEIVFCHDDQDVEEAAALMQEQRLRRLVVLDRDMRLKGMLSIGDLSHLGEKAVAGRVLAGIVD